MEKLNIKERESQFRSIRDKYNIGEFLNHSDKEKILRLFENHPKWNIKNGDT